MLSVLIVLQLFQDMVESDVSVSHYGWKCCQCCKYSMIWWEVVSLFQDYGAVNVGITAKVDAIKGKFCQ